MAGDELMARWKLMTPHYINLEEPTEWEYQEITRDGKPRRAKMKVPRYLDPRDPGDWNNSWGHGANAEGEIIVCTPGTGASRDYAFLGDPTPDMMPLDDDASAISAKFTNRWAYKPDNADTSYSQSMIDKFQVEMSQAASQPQKVEIEGLGAVLETMTALLAAQAQQSAAASPLRR
jgi:hypothetical protein